MNRFIIDPSNDFIWNYNDLLQFLIKYQGQDIYLDTRMEGCCLRSIGLYDLLDKFEFKSVVIKTYNMLEQHPKYVIHLRNPLSVFFNLPAGTDYSQFQHWNHRRVFGLLYNKPLWHRIGLAANFQSDHADKTLINFRANPHDEDQRALFEVQRLFVLHPESLEKFMTVRNQFPIQIEPTDGYTLWALTKEHTDQLCQFYTDFLIDIVSESYPTGQSFYPTEKIARPMLLKKPFILMASKNFLSNLRRLGFQTFSEFWDEDYDGYDQKERYIKILNLVQHLSTRSINELEDIYKNMMPILNHNHDLLLSKKYKLRLDE